MSVKISWEQVLAWRMERHFLDPVADVPIADVVNRLCGIQAQVASSAELAIRVRRSESEPGEVGLALAEGRLIKTWAMRGTLHLLTPEASGAFLSVMASGRSWERPSWQRYFGLNLKQWELFRPAVREALDGHVLTRDELAAAIIQRRGLEHVGEGLRSGWGTLLKPLAWQGDLCFGPSQGNRVTFTRPESASPTWAGVPDAEVAAPIAIAAYVGAYGPTTGKAFGNWLAAGWSSQKKLKTWFEALGDRLVEVDVDGERAYILAEHHDELAATKPTQAVRLLPGFDQYVLGPGTGDGHVTPTARRAAVSRQSGWIAPVVVAGGKVCGTWELDGDVARAAWFKEAGKPPRRAIEAELERISGLLGRRLQAAISLA